MNGEKISVIIPVFKVEAYLHRCVDSVVNQTYRNLEIILVDDGSPDRCGEMCDEWAKKDARIRVIHKENGGLSDARNSGMAIATGGLIGFIDSDDYIASDMYQWLYECMTADGSDIAACSVQMVYEDDTPPKMLTKAGCCVLHTQEAMEAIISESWLKQPVWYKLYKTEQVRDILFPVGKYHEDVFWSYQAIARAEKISITDRPCYFYVQRGGSIMGEGYSLKRLDAIEAKKERLRFLEQRFPKLVTRGQVDLLFGCMYHGQKVQKGLQNPEKKQAMRMLKDTVKNCALPSKKESDKLSFTYRCWMRMAKINLPLVCWIRNLLGIGV